MDEQMLCEFYVWSENEVIKILENVSDENFVKKNEKIGPSLRDLVEHLVVSWEFLFVEQSGENFNALSTDAQKLTKTELLKKWNVLLSTLSDDIQTKLPETISAPVTKELTVEMKKVDFLFLYTDHSTYHRGQLATLIRLYTEQSVVNTDYFSFFMIKNTKK
ncbi:MAG: DinB family protein [Candidatus Hodarchaeales archaeon]|jgi:uncharacterized damage-inducible protein DinB